MTNKQIQEAQFNKFYDRYKREDRTILRNIQKALNSLPLLNTEEDNLRLRAVNLILSKKASDRYLNASISALKTVK